MSSYTSEAAIIFALRIESEVIAIGLQEWLRRELFTFYEPNPTPITKPALLKYRPAKRTKDRKYGKTPDYVTQSNMRKIAA